jgi:preprotein translocase SecF subunit
MLDIIGKRRWYLVISTSLFVLGLVAMIISTIRFGTPVRLSIDFVGGSLLELRFEQPVSPDEVREVFVNRGLANTSVQSIGEGRDIIIRSKVLDADLKNEIEATLEERFGPLTELRFETVGPTVGREVTRGAFAAVGFAAVAILLFIAFSFRRVPNSFRYGTCAILAMLYNVWVSIGLFSLWGLLFGWEVDALFLTAILTVIGFSVSDTIVVFDRIRENIPKRRGEPFEVIVNRSLLETLHRSLATQLNAMFILVALMLFGGATMTHFVVTMFLGFLVGTYSSLFNAVPLLVAWENGEIRRFFKRERTASA